MPTVVPVLPGDPEQRIEITLDGQSYAFRIRWNTSDDGGAGAWYLDAWERDGTTAIAFGIKLVFGVLLGSTYHHPLFTAGLLLMGTSRPGGVPDLNELGSRAFLVHLDAADAVLMRQP